MTFFFLNLFPRKFIVCVLDDEIVGGRFQWRRWLWKLYRWHRRTVLGQQHYEPKVTNEGEWFLRACKSQVTMPMLDNLN